MWPAFPTSDYYGGSAPPRTDQPTVRPALGPRRTRGAKAGTGWFPCSLVDRSTKEVPDFAPATSLWLQPAARHHSLPVSPEQPQGSSPLPQAKWVRVASDPDPPGWSRCTIEERKRRFLAYTFPSRLPDPRHLAVLTRPGFVRAACHPYPAPPGAGCPQLRNPAATEPRCRSLTSTRSTSASRRTPGLVQPRSRSWSMIRCAGLASRLARPR